MIRKFKKGDAVYYYSKRFGTIPAIIKAVGKNPGRNKDLMWVYGESPSGRQGFINSWVHINKVELQKDNP